MATDLERLVVTLEAQNTKYLKKLDQSEKRVAKFRRQNKKALKGVSLDFKTILGGVTIGLFVRKIVDATKKQEQAVAQLEAGLASTGGVVGKSLDELKKKAAELQDVTTFGDEDIIQAQSQLLSFTSIVGAEFDKTIEIAADLSTRFGGDLKSSVIQLGKALNDPIANLSALSRSGIQFSDTQKAMIKQLVNSGDLISAQRIILAELETQFGGSARAARDTFGGALEALANAFVDLMEGESGLNEAKDSIEEFITLLKDPTVRQSANSLAAVVVKSFSAISKAIAGTVSVTKFLAEELASMASGPAIGDLVRINDKITDLSETIAVLESRPGGASHMKRLTEARKELEKYTLLLSMSQEAVVRSDPTDVSCAKPTIPPAIQDAPVLVDNDALRAAAEQQAEAIKIIAREVEILSPQLKSLADDQSLLNKAFRDGQINAETFAIAMASIDQKMVELQEDTQETLEEVTTFADQAARNMQDAFAEFLFDPFDEGLDGMLRSFARVMQRMAAEQLAANIFGGSSGSSGSSGSGGLSGLISGAIRIFASSGSGAGAPVVEGIPMRALGGPVESSQPYMVGENGPELFVPSAAGSIVPNHSLSEGNETNITNVVALDAESINDAMSTTQGARVQMNNVRLNRAGFKKALGI